jgi:hypothetical protein
MPAAIHHTTRAAIPLVVVAGQAVHHAVGMGEQDGTKKVFSATESLSYRSGVLIVSDGRLLGQPGRGLPEKREPTYDHKPLYRQAIRSRG